MPTHYGFKVGQNLDRLAQTFKELHEQAPPRVTSSDQPKQAASPSPRPSRRRSNSLATEAETVIAALNPRGLWLVKPPSSSRLASKEDARVISTQTFNKNVQILIRYLESTRP